MIMALYLSVNNIYNPDAQDNSNSSVSKPPNLDAQTVYEQKSVVLGNDIKNFVILIPNEVHESTTQDKNRYLLAN